MTHVRSAGPWNIPIGMGKGEREATSPLEERPDIASRIGIFIGQFAVIETIMPAFLSRVVGKEVWLDESTAMLGCIRSFHSKIEMIDQLVKLRPLEAETKKLCEEIIAELRWITTERNKYAHAQYVGTDSLSTIRRRAFHADSLRSTSEDVLDVAAIQAHIIRAKQLLMTLWDLATPNLTPTGPTP